MMRIKNDIAQRGRFGFTLIEFIVVITIYALFTVALTPFVRMIKERASLINCANNLRRISLGLHLYAADHDEAFPQNLGALYPDYVKEAKAFDCPATAAIGTPEDPEYKYTAGLNESSSPKEIIAEDLEKNHKSSGRSILRINGSVEFMTRRR